MKFIDIRIEFKPAGEGQSTACLSGPSIIGPPCQVDFALPFTPDHLGRLLDRINQNVRSGSGRNIQVYRTGRPPNVRYLSRQQLPAMLAGAQNQTNSPLDLTEALGKDLFIALFGGVDSQAYGVYCRSRRQAIRQRRTLRIWLVLPNDETMDRVPFEYLFDPWKGEFLAKCSDISIVRAVPVEKEPGGMPPGMLRLWYISSSPRLHSRINDFDIISDANMSAGLKVAACPILNTTIEKLSHYLDTYTQHSPHIIHISAHGRSGYVLLQDSEGQAHLAPADDLGTRLTRAEDLRVVMFNMCDNDRPVRCARDLCRHGVAVVAMQFRITAGSDDPKSDRPWAAKHFQRGFYKSYFGEYNLDCAMSEGRNEIAVNITDTMEWGTPVLVVPEFPPVAKHKLAWQRLCSFLTTRARVRWWILISVGLVLTVIFSLLVPQFARVEPPFPAIQQVDVYTNKATFKAPDDGYSFPVIIRREDGTIPIEVLAASQSRSLDFTGKVLRGEGRLEEKVQKEREAQFEYTPGSTSTVDVLEFCIHERDREAMESCIAIILDIIIH